MTHELGNKDGIALALSGFAALAALEGKEPEPATHEGQANELERAVTLFGAADALRAATAAFQRAYFEHHVAVLRDTVGEAVFESAWETGRAMTMEQAIEYALSD
jgi:hypothetical protein